MALSPSEQEKLVAQVTSPEHTAIADREHQRQTAANAALRAEEQATVSHLRKSSGRR